MPSVRELIDNYQDTVWALLGLHNELTFDDEKKKPLAESAYTSRHTEEVTLPDGAKITPDIHVVVPGGLSVGDIKISFAQDGDDRKKADIEAQLRKYDAALVHLATASKRSKDECGVVLLVHQSRAGSATRFGQSTSFEHNFAVLSYNRTDQAKVYVTLELRHGVLVPAHKHTKLSANPIQINVDVLFRFGDVRFYDAAPPDLYVAEIFWMHILSFLAAEAMNPGDGALPKTVEVEVNKAAQLLADGYSIRQICRNAKQCPSNDQMRRVFVMLKRMHLAKEVSPDRYSVTRVDFRDVRAAFEKRLKKADADDARREARRKATETRRAARRKAREEEKAAKRAKKGNGRQGELFDPS